MMTTHWTLGVLIGYPVAALGLLVALVVIGLLLRTWRRGGDSYHSQEDASLAGWLAFWGAVSIVVVSIAITASSFPWSPQYHQYRSVNGPVQAVGSRQISDGKTMSTRFVLRINDQDYGVDDTRAALAKVGDNVTISCRRDWQYAATSGYVCRWGN